MKWVLGTLLFVPSTVLACLPYQIYVKTHKVDSYTRSDGTRVKEYLRSGFCRDLPLHNYFQDTTNQKFKNISPKIKHWNASEKATIHKHITTLPSWLAKYTIGEMLRADSDGSKNPASSIPITKTMLIYDAFFRANNQQSIVIHEMSHIALWDLEITEVEKFAKASGWLIKRKNNSTQRIPPHKLLVPDSAESISEDFANHIETYYSAPESLKRHNREAFEFIVNFIQKKEKP